MINNFDDEYSISMPTIGGFSEIVNNLKNEGYSVVRNFILDKEVATELVGTNTVQNDTEPRKMRVIVTQNEGKVFLITDTRDGIDDEVFQRILSSFKFVD